MAGRNAVRPGLPDLLRALEQADDVDRQPAGPAQVRLQRLDVREQLLRPLSSDVPRPWSRPSRSDWMERRRRPADDRLDVDHVVVTVDEQRRPSHGVAPRARDDVAARTHVLEPDPTQLRSEPAPPQATMSPACRGFPLIDGKPTNVRS